MRKPESGQVIVVVAVLLVVVLLFLALIIDGSRLMVEQSELNRAADAAGKAGLIVVGDTMVTQVVSHQTALASVTLTSTPEGATPGPSLTPTPQSDEFFAWINDDHRMTLVAPPLQTMVATAVRGSLEDNSLGLSNPVVTNLEISFPDDYDPEGQAIQVYVKVDRVVAIMFGNLFELEEGELSGTSKQSIPQR
jgi:hypothetical protein